MNREEEFELCDGGSRTEITVDSADKGKRIDVLISEKENITRSAAARLIENGNVRIATVGCNVKDGKVPAKNLKPSTGDVITIDYPPPVPSEAVPEDISLDVVYEDDDIIVINKPSGMVVHPAAGNYSGTLVNALLYRLGDSLSGIGGVVRPGIVHRIDKDTSGLLVVAKNDAAHISLAEQLKTHTVSRIYYAIVTGNLKEDNGTVDAPVGRHPTDRKKMAVFQNGDSRAKPAVTHYTVLERYRGFCYVKCELETGRTHQIRVHMASLGHPLLGDEVYGGDKSKFFACNRDIIHGQCLHAGKLKLVHPRTGKPMEFECPLPPEMEKVLEKLKRLEV
ncbi:MAG: RluA family pseudouridine synthase [Clostridia bacterium]|nr:RluA family pseudouridine synthase [Clostridia bacterium]MDY3785381.1 RluA family pseudouridine synthase [Eubacteriales bacterium]